MVAMTVRLLVTVTFLGVGLALSFAPPPPAAVAPLISRSVHGQRSVGRARNRVRIHHTGHLIPPSGTILPTAAQQAIHPKHPSKIAKSAARVRATLPTTFDARNQWPACSSLSTVRDQGMCGTCWAVSSASILSDRFCIATSGANNDFISGWQTAGCSNLPSTNGTANCHDGGWPIAAFQRAAMYGLNSGGELNSNVGCVPYQVGYDTPLPDIDCKTSCSNPSFTSPSFAVDDNNHISDSVWTSYLKPGSDGVTIDPASIASQVTLMKTEILNHGSIGVIIDDNNDFSQNHVYNQNGVIVPLDTSTGGIYNTSINAHAVKVIGWDLTADGVEYWIGVNQWNTWWGDNGYFYATTGKNTISIEQSVTAPIIDASAYYSCSSASFCTQPIDTAIQMNYADPNGALYLFQGNCVQQVQVTSTGLAKVGAAMPIIKRFLTGFAGPVTSWNIDWSAGPTLTGATTGTNNCQPVAGASKYQCDDGQGYSDVPSAYTVISANKDFRYKNDGKMLSGGPGLGVYNWALSPTNFFTGNGMATVTGFLKKSATQLLVFGKSSTGAPVTGIVDYSKVGTYSGQFTWVTKPTTPSTFLTC